eukprot:CAMPEP_0202726334 /NCGR_PEP_ID=MMETSP1385-20130828/184559_1 /ASSEMBLY_ACC=CAM_ASM_000861 /TAXON_ID=933848 /ORGANISM="Elphidium margaritaceum" /LENGTH=698 /DNA_ID=CAMNT_0049392553 /DNA_START=37 /DNA_END=2133 /DNA_ORIENTATION=+
MSNGLLGQNGFGGWDTTPIANGNGNANGKSDISSIDQLFENDAATTASTSNSSKLKPYKNQRSSNNNNNDNDNSSNDAYNPFLDFTATKPSQQHHSKQPSIQENQTLDADVLDLLFDTNTAEATNNGNSNNNSRQNDDYDNTDNPFYAFNFDVNTATATTTTNNNNNNNSNTQSTKTRTTKKPLLSDPGDDRLKPTKSHNSSDSFSSSSDADDDDYEEEGDSSSGDETQPPPPAHAPPPDAVAVPAGSLKLSPPKQQSKRKKKRKSISSLTDNEKAFNKLHSEFDPSLVGTVPVQQISQKSKQKQEQKVRQKQKRSTEPISVHSQRQKQLQKEGLIKLQSPNVGASIRNDNENDDDREEKQPSQSSSASTTSTKPKPSRQASAPPNENDDDREEKQPSQSSSASSTSTKPKPSRQASAPPTTKAANTKSGKHKYNVLPELHRGTALLKYGRRGYPHFRQFNITADNESLRWFSSKKKLQQSSISVGDINEILTGQHTKEFRRISWTTLTPASFSVIYENKKKSLNLVAKSVDEMKMWVEALRTLRDMKKKGEVLCKVEKIMVEVDFRDRNRPQSRDHSGNFLRSHETKEREVDVTLQRKLIDDIAGLRKLFTEIAREANNPIVQSTVEHESIQQILSELEERVEELDHEVRHTRNTKIAENDVWRTRIDLESVREKIKVINKQNKAEFKDKSRRWSIF